MYTLAKKVRDLEPYTPVEGRFRIHLDANESFLSLPDPIREKIARLSDALNALEDDTVPVPLKNDYLKAVIERIDYYRPAAVRKRSGSSEPKVRGGWYTPPFELDVRLKI